MFQNSFCYSLLRLLVKKKLFFAVALCYVSIFFSFRTTVVFAQNIDDNNIRFGFYFKNPKKKAIKIPFKVVNNLIIIPLTVNGSDTMNFILDSGVRTTLITELWEDEIVDLKYASKIRIQGLGSEKNMEAYRSSGNEIRMKGVIGSGQNINVLLENKFNLSTKLGMRVHGLIGYEVFKSFIVYINYSKEYLILHNPERFKYRRRHRKYTEYELQIAKKQPYINVDVHLSDSTSTTVKMLLDTGSSDAIWLFPFSAPDLHIPERSIFDYLGHGLSGEIHGYKAIISNLSIGKWDLKKPTVAFPDSNSINFDYILKGRNGSLGGEIFRRFYVYFDYPNKKVLFKSNGLHKSDFHFNLSGIEVSNPMVGLPVFVISNIRKGSIAEQVGLKIDDQIMSINRSSVFGKSLNNINKLLHKKAGKTIRLTIQRNGKKHKFKFKLKDLI